MNTKNRLFKSIPIESLVATRILFGLILFWEICRYFEHDWINRKYLQPSFHFKYYGFEWLDVLPDFQLYLLFAVLGILALFIVIGFLYRFSMILFTVLFSYVFLLDQAQYLNHFYMVILFAALLSVMPANRHYAIDTLIWPEMKTSMIPFWPVFLLRVQMEVILVYAGLVKINPDWLFDLEPIKHWLYADQDVFFFGSLFTQDWALTVAAWGVVGLHLIGAPLLLVKRTRIYVFGIYCCFHMLNYRVFEIGIFPWMTMAMTLIFFDPDWPKQIAAKWFRYAYIPPECGYGLNLSPGRQKIIMTFLTLWISWQVLFPARNLLYPGYVAWTNEGHRFSWRMKLRSIHGRATFFVKDLTEQKIHWINSYDYLTRKQVRKMACRSDMILQFAHYLGKQWQHKGYDNIEVGVHASCSLNYRPKRPFIDPQVDLLKQRRSLGKADWIMPFSGEKSPSFF